MNVLFFSLSGFGMAFVIKSQLVGIFPAKFLLLILKLRSLVSTCELGSGKHYTDWLCDTRCENQPSQSSPYKLYFVVHAFSLLWDSWPIGSWQALDWDLTAFCLEGSVIEVGMFWRSALSTIYQAGCFNLFLLSVWSVFLLKTAAWVGKMPAVLCYFSCRWVPCQDIWLKWMFRVVWKQM